MTSLLLFAAGGGGHTHALLDPHSWGLVFWTSLIFGIVGIILYQFAWGPVLQALQDREAAITGRIEEAKQKLADAERLKAEYEARLEIARQEADAIIKEGEADKQRIISEAHGKATKEASDVRGRADRDIVLAKNKALSEIKDQASSLGLAIAERVLQAEIDPSRHQKIIDDVVATYERS
jgi:F-type H+-transporting ATPase subunit b